MNKIVSFLTLLVFISFIFLIPSCNEEEKTQVQNRAPQIQNISANPSTIYINGQTTLSCLATDLDGDQLSINWDSQSGTFPNGKTGQEVNWQAPATVGIYTITATVSDGQLIDKDSINVNVQVLDTIPQAPMLLLPLNGSTNVDVSPTLIWSSVAGATSYSLQVSINSNFTNLVFNQSGLTITSQQLTGLGYLGTYYWRVNAFNVYGKSNWTQFWYFFTKEPEPCPGLPTITDVRDGKVYNTVLIGDQCWLRENMNIGRRIDGILNQTDNDILEKYCYNNLESNCDTYGGLYQWNEAMQYITTEGARGICLPGWHLPTLAEFTTLKSAVNNDGNALKALGEGTNYGAGTNTSGFSALLAGYRYYNGYFYNLGYNAYFWSSTEYDIDNAYGLNLNYSNSYINLYDSIFKDYGFSVRCLKD